MTAKAFAFLLLATLSAAAQQPDTIFFHGNILTGAHLTSTPTEAADPTPARVQAIAVAHGRILTIGSDLDVLKLKSAATRLIDLNGAFALPGFNDAHTHMAAAGEQKLSIDLDRVPSLAAMLNQVQTYSKTRKPGTWLRGGGWDHTLWPGKHLPTRQDLDHVTGGHPALLWRTDYHMAIANSAALVAAGITVDTPDPPGAQIDRDLAGQPTGILRETAATDLVSSIIPPAAPEDRRRALEAAIADALSHGVTSVQDFSGWEDFLVLESMEREGKLHLRVSEWLDFTLPLAVLESRRASHSADDALLHTGMLKGFMDGSLGSRTAALAAPYADDAENSGIPRYEQDKLNAFATERAAAGFQIGFHAIGDRANEIAVNALTAAAQAYTPLSAPAPPRTTPDPDATIVGSNFSARLTEPTRQVPVTAHDPRFRIEHAQVLLPEDFQRFHDEHIIASMQPSHLLTDMAWAAARLGPERSQYAYAWKSFLDHGVILAFGTDYPVESINPMRGLYAAVSRANTAGTATFHPEQVITLNQAIYAYTQASAFAEFAEAHLGRLTPGFCADLAVLDRDITAVKPRELLATRVVRTVVNGEVVFDATQSTQR